MLSRKQINSNSSVLKTVSGKHTAIAKLLALETPSKNNMDSLKTSQKWLSLKVDV